MVIGGVAFKHASQKGTVRGSCPHIGLPELRLIVELAIEPDVDTRQGCRLGFRLDNAGTYSRGAHITIVEEFVTGVEAFMPEELAHLLKREYSPRGCDIDTREAD
jgi:hypothetical protein